MATYQVFESPVQGSGLKGKKARSAPIDVTNVKSIQTLTNAGWKVVEEFEHEDSSEPHASNLPRVTQELLAAQRGEVELAFEDEGVDVDALTETSEVPEVGTEFDWQGAGLNEAQWQALYERRYHTADELNAATDAELQAIPGIGAATVRNLRKFLKS